MDEQQRREMIKQVFNTVAPGYGRGALRFFENAASQLPKQLNLRGDEKILDVACGTGLATARLAEAVPGGDVIGVDLSNGMLDQARQRVNDKGIRNIEFIQSDMTRMEAVPASRFDVANCSFGIFFVEDMPALVRHIVSRIKPGGRIITTHFAMGAMSPMNEMMRDRLASYDVQMPPIAWQRVATEALNRELYESAGLSDIQHARYQAGYLLNSPEDWWDVIWWAGYRGLVSQLSPPQLEAFKRDHLADVAATDRGDGIFFNVEVLYTLGTRPND